MYTVQVLNWSPGLSTHTTFPPQWTGHTTVEQMKDEIAELAEARAVERLLSLYCKHVRIVKSLPSGARMVVR